MFLFLVIVTAISAASAAPRAIEHIAIDPTLNGRIVNGTDAPDGAFPFIISVRDFNDDHNCGGSIISENYVLTAAHCVNGSSPGNWTIVAGSNQLNTGGVRYQISQIITHKGYKFIHTGLGTAVPVNDIALLKIATPIDLSHEKISVVNLSQQNSEETINVTIAGWGTLVFEGSVPNNLQYLNASTLSYERCKNIFTPYPIYENQVCAFATSGQGACNGDSGGPLLSAENNALVGVVSWGIPPCASGFPDVYTRVYSFLDWIKVNVEF